MHVVSLGACWQFPLHPAVGGYFFVEGIIVGTVCLK